MQDPLHKIRSVSDKKAEAVAGDALMTLQLLTHNMFSTPPNTHTLVLLWCAVLLRPQVFGRVVDPENFADQAYLPMNAWQVELADSRIGCLRLFSPDNPTGGLWVWLSSCCLPAVKSYQSFVLLVVVAVR
jgi:hypothetical protein